MGRIEVNINRVPIEGVLMVDFDEESNCFYFYMDDGRILVLGPVINSY